MKTFPLYFFYRLLLQEQILSSTFVYVMYGIRERKKVFTLESQKDEAEVKRETMNIFSIFFFSLRSGGSGRFINMAHIYLKKCSFPFF